MRAGAMRRAALGRRMIAVGSGQRCSAGSGRSSGSLGAGWLRVPVVNSALTACWAGSGHRFITAPYRHMRPPGAIAVEAPSATPAGGSAACHQVHQGRWSRALLASPAARVPPLSSESSLTWAAPLGDGHVDLSDCVVYTDGSLIDGAPKLGGGLCARLGWTNKKLCWPDPVA